MPIAAPTATSRYYDQIELHYGYADKEMRGAGHARIRLKPIGETVDDGTAIAYCAPLNGHQRRLPDGMTRRELQLERQKRTVHRASTAEEMLDRLKDLIVDVGNRIDSKPTCAARDAIADARALLRGRDTLAHGSRGEQLATLVRILERYA